MDDLLLRDVKEFKKRHTRRRLWHGILTVLASIVVFVTTYALILPAVTMTASHIHDESCYTQVSTIEKTVLACPVLPEDGLLVVHRHDAACYDDGTLVCPLPELAEHTHTADCYAAPETHVHTEECYSAARGELVCGLDEGEAHIHTDECYAWQTLLSCGQTEDESAEPVLICEQKEVVLHQHDDACYAADGTLICALPEVISHQHTDSCFETREVPADTQTLTCTNSDPDHVHTVLCYGTWILTCDQGMDEPSPDEPSEDEPVEPSEEEPDGDASVDEINDRAGAITLKYYVYLDDAPRLISEEYTSLPVENKRHYITAAQLETVYAAYGFAADAYTGERFFPHTDHNDPSVIWADAPAYQAETDDGTLEWRIPLSTRNTSYIYYLPHNSAGFGSYFEGSKKTNDETLIRDNTFYTINISAPPTAASESGIYHVQRGDTFSVELSMFADYVWSFNNLKDGAELPPDGMEPLEDGRMRFTFSSVTQPIKIAALLSFMETREYTIVYHANTLSSNLRQLSSAVSVDAQQIVTNGTVGGMAMLSEKIKVSMDTVYQLRNPDVLSLMVRSNKTKQEAHFFYTFRGWRVKTTGELLEPGQALTMVQLNACETGGVVELEAVWGALDARERIASVNFYLNLKCEIRDFHSNGFSDVAIGEFTKSLFSSGIQGTEKLTTPESSFLLLAPPTTDDTAYEVDGILRAMTDTPYGGVTLDSFPSDQEMFALLRENGYTIQILGQDIPTQHLTPDYFQIRWASLKYDSSDCWHVDGVLVAKEAKLRVTKTFLGSDTAIDRVKAQTGDQEYSILIENVSANDADDERLTLVPASEETREGCVGYESYDAASNTYTWIAGGRIDSNYALSEQNYLLEDIASASYYRISDTANPGSWQSYDDDTPVQTAMVSYPADTPQRRYRTVAFQNSYLDTGTLTLRKIDSFTQNGIADVEFQLTGNDGQSGQLRRKPGTSMYTNVFSANTEYTEDAGSTIVTDANGEVYLWLSAGSYTLREAFPEGYSGAEEICFTVDETGKLTALTFDGKPPAASAGGISSGVGTALLVIENEAHVLTTVTAVKDWGEVPEDWQEPVTVTLMYDGAPLGGVNSAYTQVLCAENNWTYVWEGLPLFLDGEVADYALKEIAIGDTPFNSAIQDGYTDYAVSQDPAKYREGAAGDYDDPASWVDAAGVQHYANHVLLTVRNRPDGDVGRLTVKKLFERIDETPISKLDGAYTFALYETPDGSGTPVATASVVYANGTVTPEDGAAQFSGLTLGKTYYVFELDDRGTPVPDGEAALISGTPYTVFGGGAAVPLSPEHPSGEAAITNRINYAELPETGGRGTGIFYVLGAFLTMAGTALLLLQKRCSFCRMTRRRQETESKYDYHK